MFVSETRDAVEKLLAEGLSPNAIALELGLASQTVRYHVGRIRSGATDGRVRAKHPVELDESARRRPTRQLVAELLQQGLSRAEIARTIGVGKPTVSYHARQLGAEIDGRCARRYDWSAVQRFHDAGHGVRECLQRFGMSPASWYDAVRRGDLASRPGRLALDELLVAGTHRSRGYLKRRLLAAGLKETACERCGISEWGGRPLSLALHHVNGDRLDNRLENLELLCPNCHSQTENFSGRNGSGVRRP